MEANGDRSTKCQMCYTKREVMKRCTRCRLVFYCSRECQVKDWSDHRTKCGVSEKSTANKEQQECEKPVSTDKTSTSSDGETKWNSEASHDAESRKISTSGAAPLKSGFINFQKAFDDLEIDKKDKSKHVSSPSSSETVEQKKNGIAEKRGTYIFHDKIMDDLPTLDPSKPTISINIKGNKRKQQLTLQSSWSAQAILKFVSHKSEIPLNKLKLIHKGKLMTEENLLSFLTDNAVFQVIGEKCESWEGLNPRDIELIMKQVRNVSRNQAIRALREKQGDTVDAILFLTE